MHTELTNSLADEAHLYLAFTHKHFDARLLEWYLELLSIKEKERLGGFTYVGDRNQYLINHGLLRAVLSRYVTKEPRHWELGYTRYGRPEIKNCKIYPILRFTLSRAQGLVVILIALCEEVGVDVEKIREFEMITSVFERVLSPVEIWRLAETPEKKRSIMFLRFWTLKECYMKARGYGFLLPPKEFFFYKDGADYIHIALSPEIHDQPSNWQFESNFFPKGHAVSIALRRGNIKDLRINFIEAVPQPDMEGLGYSEVTNEVFKGKNQVSEESWDCSSHDKNVSLLSYGLDWE